MWNVLVNMLKYEENVNEEFKKYIQENEMGEVNSVYSISMALYFKESKIRSKLFNFIKCSFTIIAFSIFLSLFFIIQYFNLITNERLIAILIWYVSMSFILLIYNFVVKKYRLKIYEKYYNDNLVFLVFLPNPLLRLDIYEKNGNEYKKIASYNNLENYYITNLENRTSINIYDREKRIVANYEILGMNTGNRIGRTLSFFKIVGASRKVVDPCWDTYELLKYFKKNGSKLEYVTKKYIKDTYSTRF